MEKLHQIEMKGDSVQEDIQRALGTGEDDARSLGMEADALTEIKVQVNAIEGNMAAVQGKVDAIEGNMEAVQGKVDAIEGKVDAIEGKVDAVQGNMKAQSAETKQMKDMMSQLIEQNKKFDAQSSSR